jgi:hypothetical protein
MKRRAAVLAAAALACSHCGRPPDGDTVRSGRLGGHPAAHERRMMAEECERLTVTQIGGIAGNSALPPLVDVGRSQLGAADRRVLDDACDRLAAAAASGASAGAIGADIAHYRIEITDRSGEKRSFTLPGPGSGAGRAGEVDVPTLLGPLIQLPSIGTNNGS